MKANLIISAIFATSMVFSVLSYGNDSYSVSDSSKTVKNSMCRFVIKNLKSEIIKTENKLKSCKDLSSKKCSWYSRKLKFTKNNLRLTEKQCHKGITPDFLPIAVEGDTGVKNKTDINNLLPKKSDDIYGVSVALVSGEVNALNASDPAIGRLSMPSVSPLAVNSNSTASGGPEAIPSSLEVLQSKIVNPEEISSEALSDAESVIDGMFKNADKKVVKELADNDGVEIFIIPKDKKITDLKGFEKYENSLTRDGRQVSDMRGVTFLNGPGSIIVVGENHLLETEEGITAHIRRHTMVHELGHGVLDEGLPEKAQPSQDPPGIMKRIGNAVNAFSIGVFPQNSFKPDISTAMTGAKLAWKDNGEQPSCERIEEIYEQSMTRSERTGLGAYADSYVHENFAEATTIYFNVRNSDSDLNANYLYEKQPEMAMMLYKIYGPPRGMKNE